MKPETIAVSFTEGGDWVDFDEVRHKRPPDRDGWRVHAVLFSDLTIWDAYNGWRVREDNHLDFAGYWPDWIRAKADVKPSYSHWGMAA